MKKKPNKRQRAVANYLLKGLGPTQAIRAGGYPDAQARKGMAFIDGNAGIKQELIRKAKSMTPEAMEALSIGRLLENIVSGEDRAVQSVKLLGSHRKLDLWRPDSQVGIVVLTPPASLDPNALSLPDLESSPPKESVAVSVDIASDGVGVATERSRSH